MAKTGDEHDLFVSRFRHNYFQGCILDHASRLEAEGIEPSSQDNPNGSLYMLSLVVCSRPCRRSRAIFGKGISSKSRPLTNDRIREPARVLRPACCGHQAVPRLPL